MKIRSFQPQTIICGCAARFVSDLVGNHDDRFSHDAAHIVDSRDCPFVPEKASKRQFTSTYFVRHYLPTALEAVEPLKYFHD